MDERPILSRSLDSRTFRDFYYLKEELVEFCRDNGIPSSGGKMEITERIACFLETGNVMPATARKKRTAAESAISEDSRIEADFVCSERHRAFFRKVLGDSFRFNVPFQKWLKDNSGKTYREAIAAYRQTVKAKNNSHRDIGRQFEYNTYIRDFFADNKGKTLQEAIRCWKYKKQQQGHNRYERSDLAALWSE